jgi:hypothetical protein
MKGIHLTSFYWYSLMAKQTALLNRDFDVEYNFAIFVFFALVFSWQACPSP